MNSADRRAHDPTIVQPLFLSDSEISPITSPAGSKGYATPARQYKRPLDKTSPDARPDRRTGGDVDDRSRSPKSYEPPVGPVRFDEAYLTEMVKSMSNMAQAIMELNKRNQTLEQECARWSKWSSDNAVRVMQIEGRINDEANKGQAFTLERFKAIEVYLDGKKFEERVNRMEEMVAGHNYYMDHLYQVKPAEGYTIKTGFEAIAQQVLEIKQNMTLNEQAVTQIAAGAAQTETVVMQISSALEDTRKDTQKQFDDVRSEVSVKITEVQYKMGNLQAEIAGVPSAYPPGWERPARQQAPPASQFCGNFMSGCGGCGDSMHGHSPPQGPLSHGVGHSVGPGGAQQRFGGVGSGVGPG